MLRIVVGSGSAIKLEAVREAAASIGLEADITGLEAPSGIPPQPYGRSQTIEGAMNRAYAARESAPTAYAVGIENGLVPNGHWIGDVAYVVVIAPSGQKFLRRSTALSIPEDLADEAAASGYQMTIGAILAARTGGDPADPHAALTNGQSCRKDFLAKAVYAALLAATINEEGGL